MHPNELQRWLSYNLCITVVIVLVGLACAGCNDREAVTPPAATVPATISNVQVITRPVSIQTSETVTQSADASQPPGMRATQPPFTSPLTTDSKLNFSAQNSYGNSPLFQVQYTDKVWLIEASGDGMERPQLAHRTLPDCKLRLRGGARGYSEVDNTTLVGRKWYLGKGHEIFLSYYTKVDEHFYIFDLQRPVQSESTARQSCEQAAEVVLETFMVLEE